MTLNIKYIGEKIEEVSKPYEEDFVSQYFTATQAREFKPLLSFLNDKDRDILFLIFVSRKKQKEVQKILNRTQSSLCYDIKRIRKRLKFISFLFSVFDIFINFVQKNDLGFSLLELKILILMFYTSSYTLTARVLKTSQVKVRYIFNKCLKKMENAEAWEIYEIYFIIRSNLNIVRRVYSKQKSKNLNYFV